MVCCSEKLCGARLALREGLVCYSGFFLLCGAGRSGSGNLLGLLFRFFFLLLREAGRSGSGNLPGLLLWGVRSGSFEEPARDPAPTAAAPPLG